MSRDLGSSDGDVAKLRQIARDEEFFGELDDLERRHGYESRKKNENSKILSIPGPAGGVLDIERKEYSNRSRQGDLTQLDVLHFDKNPWKSVNTDLETSFSISKIKELPQVKKNKEKSAFIVKTVVRYEIDALVLLIDKTGEMEATVSRDVIEKYPFVLTPGTGIQIFNYSIYTPSPLRNHIIVTLKNVTMVVGPDPTTLEMSGSKNIPIVVHRPLSPVKNQPTTIPDIPDTSRFKRKVLSPYKGLPTPSPKKTTKDPIPSPVTIDISQKHSSPLFVQSQAPFQPPSIPNEPLKKSNLINTNILDTYQDELEDLGDLQEEF